MLLLRVLVKKREKKTLAKVKFVVTGKDNSHVYVDALVSNICSPLSGHHIEFTKSTYPHLYQLDLADSDVNGGSISIDILKSADFYWQFMSGKVICPPNDSGPIAME